MRQELYSGVLHVWNRFFVKQIFSIWAFIIFIFEINQWATIFSVSGSPTALLSNVIYTTQQTDVISNRASWCQHTHPQGSYETHLHRMFLGSYRLINCMSLLMYRSLICCEANWGWLILMKIGNKKQNDFGRCYARQLLSPRSVLPLGEDSLFGNAVTRVLQYVTVHLLLVLEYCVYCVRKYMLMMSLLTYPWFAKLRH
jgi:hypothetical protein